jgi:hypothetical protein
MVNSISGIFINPINFLIYRVIRVCIYKFSFTKLEPWLFYFGLTFRSNVIKNKLKNLKAKLAILQCSEDFLSGLRPRSYKVILDLPTIYSEEIKLKNAYPQYIIDKIVSLENRAYQQSDRLCFHWYSFLNLAQKMNKKISHPFVLNWGCDQKRHITNFSNNPKIIYLGNLNSYWINSNLLESVNLNSPIPLKIFSYEKPNPTLYTIISNVNYMKSLDKLSDYQFGLITLINDNLRDNGFSAKYLNYIEHGIPVLCPDWRKDKLLKAASIYYNEQNISKQIKKYNTPKLWIKKHKAALNIAKKLEWNNTLKQLLIEINSLLCE